MKKSLIKAVFLITLFAFFNPQKGFSLEETIDSYLKEMVFVVALQDLIFSEDGISVNWEGNTYPISSLEQEGNQWVARTLYKSRYCLEGHNLCDRCSLCHLKRCRYYVPPCWQ